MSAPMDRSDLLGSGGVRCVPLQRCVCSPRHCHSGSRRFAKRAGSTLTGVTRLDYDAGVVPGRGHGLDRAGARRRCVRAPILRRHGWPSHHKCEAS